MAKKRQSKFKGKVNRNVETQETASSSYGYLILPKGVNMYKPDPGGRVRLDVMPYIVSDKKHLDRDEEYEIAIPGEPWYKKPYKVHKNIGPNDESVVCPRTFGKPCPICEHRLQLTKEGETDKEALKALAAKDRNLYVVIPLGHKDYDETPHIMDISWWLFQDLLNDELEEDESNEVFPDLEEGKTLKIRWDSKKIDKGQPYAEVSRIDFVDREEAYDESIMDEVPDLDKVLKVLPYKELEALFFDEDIDDDDEVDEDFDEVDEDEIPKRKKKTTRKVKEEDDDDDEKPKRKKTTRKPDPEPEEDDDDDEEAPKKKKRKKATPKGKCPYGYEYGVDADEKEECNSCDLWDDCLTEKEKNED
jgi:hypothetical protein